MQVNRPGIIVVLMLVLISCGGKLDRRGLVRWVEDPKNGLHKTKTIGELTFDVQYQPMEYLQARESGEAVSDSLSSMQYFALKLSPADGVTPILYLNGAEEQEYLQRSIYYSFRFRDDIYLRTGDMRIPCHLFIAENTGNIRPELRFTVAFETGSYAGDVQLVINDRVFRNGEIKFLFKEEQLTHIPSVDLNS